MSIVSSPDKEDRQAFSHPTAPRDGIHAALWIPTDHAGNLMKEPLATHLSWLKMAGVHGVLALGSTGEFPRMSVQFREEVLSEIIRLAAPLPVIANISCLQLADVVALGKHAKRAGAVGAALMPPPFFPLSQPDILEFFLRAAEEVDLPLYLYNYPEVTSNRIGLEVIAAFAERAPMVGIKQSGSELSYHKDLIALGREKNFSVFTAADPFLAKYLNMGAAGCLGGVANFAPELMLEVYEACRRGRPWEADAASARLEEIGAMLSVLHLPLNVRCALDARGFEPGALKSVVSQETKRIYLETKEKLRQTFRDWNLPLHRHSSLP